MSQPFRAFVSWGLIVCMLFSLLPLGCHSPNARYGPGGDERPQLPEATAEQLKECGELIQTGIERGRRAIDAQVKVDEDGHVWDATTTGEPNPDVGMCVRGVLRDMQVDREVIEEASRRSRSSAMANAGTIPNRTYMGQVETIVVVTVVYVEVIIIDEVLVCLGLTVTATVGASAVYDAAHPNARRAGVPRGTRKPHQPNVQKWMDNGGSIHQKADGTATYTRIDGVAVTYDKAGFPDLTPYRHPTVKDVQIEFTGDYDKDRKLADTAAAITKKMRDDEGYVWHHHQDGKTMQLIKQDVHEDFFHTGGMAGTRKR